MALDELVARIESDSLRPRIGPTGDPARLKSAITQLDARERDMLTLVAERKSDSDIAKTLWVAQQTVVRARPRLIRKLHAENERDPSVKTVDLVARASMVRELYIEHEATPEEEGAVKEAFARAGFPVTIKRGLEWSGEGEAPWGVVFSATVPLPVFFAAFATDGENDPYAAVKAWAQAVFEAWRGARWKRGAILIHGRDSSISLSSDISEIALDSLAEVDWAPSRIIDRWEWDADQNAWGDPAGSAHRRKWSNRLLMGAVAAGLARLQRRRG